MEKNRPAFTYNLSIISCYFGTKCLFYSFQIACRYIDDPVLFDFMDSGMHKFDLRYMVLLHSVDPLRLSLYRGFIVRFAAKLITDYVLIGVVYFPL